MDSSILQSELRNSLRSLGYNKEKLQPGEISAKSINLVEHGRDKISSGSWNYTKLVQPASVEAFNEDAYLAINPDVIDAIKNGVFSSGLDHFCKAGHAQNRNMFFNDMAIIADAKRVKLDRFRDVFLPDLPINSKTLAIDTVGDKFPEDVPISAWGYNPELFEIIGKHQGGVIVDLGAGLRPEYFDDIINLELGNFITTDVRSIGEKLPFKDNSIDCLFSIAVFEHVMRPWDVAREVERVVKPGGTIHIDTAFMAGRHGYPNHYYNMTLEGLANLFTQVDVEASHASRFGHAAYSVYWATRIFRDGLPPGCRQEFEDMKIGEMLSYTDPHYLLVDKPYLRELNGTTNDDLAFNVTMTGRKKI